MTFRADQGEKEPLGEGVSPLPAARDRIGITLAV